MLALAGVATRVSSQQPTSILGVARSGALSLSGVVPDPSGNAIANVAVSQIEKGQAAHTTRAGADGFFELDRLPRGAVDLEFRRIGFKLRTMTIDVQQGTDPLQLVLEAAVTHLDTMIVLAEHHVPSRLVGFYSRAKEGFGTFFDETAINKYGVAVPTDVRARRRSGPGPAHRSRSAAQFRGGGGGLAPHRGAGRTRAESGVLRRRRDLDEVKQTVRAPVRASQRCIGTDCSNT